MVETSPFIPSQDDDEGARSKQSSFAVSIKKRSSNAQNSLRRSIWLDSWLFEWITLVFSLTCFIAVSIILWIYDGNVRPEMGNDLSLNTFVSLLATGSRSALVLVIGEAISQLKWLWFRNPPQGKGSTQLIAIQRFDAASRGPLGSLMIIVHHRAQSLVSLGAVIIVLLLAFDPFMQQVLSYPIRSTLDSSSGAIASAPQLRGYLPVKDRFEKDGLFNAYSQGFFSDQDFSVPPQCSSGNCTWDTFSSVSICSQCSDMAATAVLDCELPPVTKSFNRTCRISLPGGFDKRFLVEFQYLPYSSQLTMPSKIIWEPFNLDAMVFNSHHTDELVTLNLPNITLAGMKNPPSTLAYIELDLDESETAPNASASKSMFIKNATACSLSTCLKDYTVVVKNGKPSIQTQNVDFGTTYLRYPGAAFPGNNLSRDLNPLCWMPGPPDIAGYQESKDFAFCHSLLWNLNARSYFPSTEQETWLSNGHGFSGGVYGDVENDQTRAQQLQRKGLEQSMTSIAASLTKYGLEKTNHSIQGKVHVSQVFVRVRWPWMILPGLLIVVGAIFLVVVIVVSKKRDMPLWKSSALASYYHGIEGPHDDEEYSTSSIMEKKAEGQKYHLGRSRISGKMVLQQREDDDATETIL